MSNLYVGRMFTYKGRCGYGTNWRGECGGPEPGGIAIILHESSKRVTALIGEKTYNFSKYYLKNEVEQEYDNVYNTLVTSIEVMMKAAEKLRRIEGHPTTNFDVGELIEQLTQSSVKLRAMAEEVK